MSKPEGYSRAKSNAGDGSPPTHIGGRIADIFVAFIIMTVPMVLFSALLLGLVYHYRIVQNAFVSEDLAFDSGQNDPNVFFAKINSTTLITIASWCSTIAPILVGFAVTLISYSVASSMLTASEKQKVTELPTPYQLSLLLRMLSNSSLSSLWSWLKYSCGSKGRRQSQGRSLKTLTSILILGIILSTLVFICDTWLHLTTETVTFFQVEPNPDPPSLSFGVITNCTNSSSDSFFSNCNMDDPASGAILLSSSPVEVLSNISVVMNVRTHTVGELQFAYLGSAQLSRLASSSIDYTANTYAVNSQCTPVTKECKMGYIEDGVGAQYECPFEFAGTAYTNVGAANSVTMSYFTNSSGQNNDTDRGSISNLNPYYYAAVAVVNMRNPPSAALINDPEIVGGMHGGSTIVAVWCNATVYDLQYTTVNGTITRFITEPSNNTITKIVQATQRRTEVGNANLVQAASVAGLGNTSQSISDQFALSYSETALAVASGAFEPRAVTESQLRTQILVARVPKAPLGFLVLMNLLLAVLGIVLAIIAWKSLQHSNTGEIQARLSIPAMVASHFEHTRVLAPVEKVEDMFEESHGELGPRIGFLKTAEGAWVFGTWNVG